ncbi:MAG: Na(+)-translocating NADH-quinone reductase subunit C [Halobacteriovoraceae bacterium]|nr:Na(+)-translocating NADH-quinone reductase subunit C [Halobacteriovoraceae bacterium]
MPNDSVKKTVIVAAALCIVCSILVSGAAVILKPLQNENKILDVKKNLLMSAGLIQGKTSKEEILEQFKKVKTIVIDLSTGAPAEGIDPETFDQRKAAKDPKMSVQIPGDKDTASIKSRSKFSKVYHVMDGDQIKMIVLPVHGKGLWSTLYGFLALAPDTRTIKGFGFYEHGETPGLGGEVDNPNWKKSWIGKSAINNNNFPAIEIVKGQVDPNSPTANSKVDGLSGATITSRGVQHLLHYWLGEDGFSKYLAYFRANNGGM